MQQLHRYRWPGNVRELQHLIERIVILNDSETLTAKDINLSPAVTQGEAIPFNNYQLEEAEKILIIKAVSKHDGNLTRAAKDLGITRAALYRRLEKYGL